MDRRRQRLAEALNETGLWRAAEPAERLAQLKAIRTGDYPLHLPIFDDVCFPADGEHLAGGGIEELLAAMAPALAEHGLRLKVRRHDGIVIINDLSCGVCTTAREATLRPLAVVNELLAHIGATVRIFTLYTGGSQGLAYLLDPRVAQAMRLSGIYDRRELPELAAV
jgi:hypothetical protein